jgi:hypothetical protein
LQTNALAIYFYGANAGEPSISETVTARGAAQRHPGLAFRHCKALLLLIRRKFQNLSKIVQKVDREFPVPLPGIEGNAFIEAAL